MTEGNASAGNLLANLPLRLSEELVEILLSAPGLRVERIVSTGQTSPPDFWYDQDQAEFVVLLQGSARLRFEEETITMTPGSYVSIAARRRHRVEETDVHQPTVWLAIHHG